MWKYSVVEYQKSSGIVNVSQTALTMNCWNILYSVPYDPADDAQTEQAFTACAMWIENNKNATSKYLIQEFYFYD